jgi:hypothetical protein
MVTCGGLTRRGAAVWVTARLKRAGWRVSPATAIRWRGKARNPENAPTTSGAYGTDPAAWTRKPAAVFAEEIIAKLLLYRASLMP